MKGNATLQGVLVLAIIALIMISAFLPGTGPTPSLLGPTYGGAGQGSVGSGGGYQGTPQTTYDPSTPLRLGSGNARYSYQPHEEYITIANSGSRPVDITNWQLRNAKDERIYELGGALRRLTADSARIPKGALFIAPGGNYFLQNIVLEPNETAIITTGSMPSRLPYRIVSFKENICSGYLAGYEEYDFDPALSRSCPMPRSEPGATNLALDCRRYVESMPSCYAPEIGGRIGPGNDLCPTCVDGQIMPSSCVAYIKEHFTYEGCLKYHKNDPNFSLDTWRIFLGQGWQLWADDSDTIKLFDPLGNLVDSISY